MGRSTLEGSNRSWTQITWHRNKGKLLSVCVLNLAVIDHQLSTKCYETKFAYDTKIGELLHGTLCKDKGVRAS